MINIHGGDIYSYNENIIDFSSNINPLGIPESGKKAMLESIERMSRYPDMFCRKLRNKIAYKETISYKNIICGNGAAELIYNIVSALNPKKVLLTAPTFSEYEQAADVINAEKVFYTMREESNFEIGDDILEYIDNSFNLMFICNPNNPTGMLVNRGLLNKIIDKCCSCGVFLVIDECFMDFTDGFYENSAVKHIYNYNNIFILKAFTKMYAMAGLRLGYGICGDLSIVEKMYKVRQSWNVSEMAQNVGCAVIDEIDFCEKTRSYIKKERKYLENELNKLGLKYFKSEVNFILFKAERGLCDKMIEKGFLIRNCGNYRGLTDEFYRISVKNQELNFKFINAIISAVKKIDRTV